MVEGEAEAEAKAEGEEEEAEWEEGEEAMDVVSYCSQAYLMAAKEIGRSFHIMKVSVLQR